MVLATRPEQNSFWLYIKSIASRQNKSELYSDLAAQPFAEARTLLAKKKWSDERRAKLA